MLQLEEAVELYREQAKFPDPSSGYISNVDVPGHIQVNSVWSQRDLVIGERITFSRSHFLQLDMVFSTPPQECVTELLKSQSRSGKQTAILREVKNDKGEDKQFIEIWSGTNKVHNIDVSKLDQHGRIYEDCDFGSLEWSNNEGHLLYVAEKKQPTLKSFFEPETESDIKEGVAKGDEFVFKEDWGEAMRGKCNPVMCVLDIESGVVSVLDNIPDDVAAGQALWCENDEGIVCVGLLPAPYKLGLCPNRRSALFYINLKTSSCTQLTGSDIAVSSPRFSRDYSRLVYLQYRVGGTHAQSGKLMMIDWTTKGIVTVIDIVKYEKGDAFPGLQFFTHLTNRCWSKDNKRVVMSTYWRSKKEIIVIDTDTGHLTRLTNDNELGGWTLLDVHNDLVLAACSSLNHPPYLVLGQKPAEGTAIKWTKLDQQTPKLDTYSWRILPMDVPKERVNPQYPNLDYDCVLLEPKGNDVAKAPLVVLPHGGPHLVFTPEYELWCSVLVQCGFVVLLVNFRGSLGFGDDSIRSLPGNVGTQDVNDVQGAAEKVLEMGIGDREKVVMIGASHGGLLTAHLIGQFPDFYKAAVLHNPAVNLPAFVTQTDIPDWCYVECGIADKFDYTRLSGMDLMEETWKHSPARYFDKIKTPAMILLGADDRRVPNYQGHEMRRVLQARGVKVRTLSYPMNNHQISKPDSEADAFINVVRWFLQHI